MKILHGVSLLLLAAALILCFVSCNRNSSASEYSGDGFVSRVVEVGKNSLIVEPRDADSPEARSSDRFSVPNYFESRVKKGDTVIIEHDGIIRETYPASFHKIFSMTLVGDDGINENVCID